MPSVAHLSLFLSDLERSTESLEILKQRLVKLFQLFAGCFNLNSWSQKSLPFMCRFVSFS